MDASQLKLTYDKRLASLQRFERTMHEQLLQLLASRGIGLGMPLESRVKTWASIEEKMARKARSITTLLDIGDLVGLRAIFLFKRDLDAALGAVNETFLVRAAEDTSERLGDTAFGYQSIHLAVSPPGSWQSLPALRDCEDLKMELQLRTLSQHIWAAASHKLQYKQEAGVPMPIRRAIHRVSALLETVDLEFERVLEERDAYTAVNGAVHAEPELNVEVLRDVLDSMLPPENLQGDVEDYGDLLQDLQLMEITTRSQLVALVNEHIHVALAEDALRGLGSHRFYTHCGLIRISLAHADSKKWREVEKERRLVGDDD